MREERHHFTFINCTESAGIKTGSEMNGAWGKNTIKMNNNAPEIQDKEAKTALAEFN